MVDNKQAKLDGCHIDSYQHFTLPLPFKSVMPVCWF